MGLFKSGYFYILDSACGPLLDRILLDAGFSKGLANTYFHIKTSLVVFSIHGQKMLKDHMFLGNSTKEVVFLRKIEKLRFLLYFQSLILLWLC